MDEEKKENMRVCLFAIVCVMIDFYTRLPDTQEKLANRPPDVRMWEKIVYSFP